MNKILLTLAVIYVGVVVSRPQAKTGDTDFENRLHYLYYPTPEDQVEVIFNDTRSLQASNLKPGAKTIFLLDGFTAPALTPMNTETKNTFAGREDVNVIIVDWSAYSGWGRPTDNLMELYFQILFVEMPKAGEDLADFIQFLTENIGITYDNVTLIGHSMGCHTCGSTGRWAISKYNKTIGRIIALDPAVQFSEFDATMRLRIGDADVVEAYKTDRDVAGDMYPASADVTIYVNGGDNQPCASIKDGDQIAPMCDDHGFSWKLYNYSRNNDTLKACPCRGAACLCKGCENECGDDGIGVGLHLPESARGSYHLKTGNLGPW